MSFRCQRCGVAHPNPQKPEERLPTQVVVDVRVRRYRPWDNFNVIVGWEIVKEQKICSACLATHVPPTVNLTEAADQEPHVESR